MIRAGDADLGAQRGRPKRTKWENETSCRNRGERDFVRRLGRTRDGSLGLGVGTWDRERLSKHLFKILRMGR